MSLSDKKRVKLVIQGAVQGVGFRPFVYRLASNLELAGWISNSAHGVTIEAEGAPDRLQRFVVSLAKESPERAILYSMECLFLDPVGYSTFEIKKSSDSDDKSAWILPDIATCSDCTADIFDKNNRRYLYPFTNCTNCGPRYTIIEALPYDRPNTSMKSFKMCPDCQMEYENPQDRRFHAQPNACPACGPQLTFCRADGLVMAEGHEALMRTVTAIDEGKIVAVKGLGGFHLIVDATDDRAVLELRRKKHRDEKPFAMMFPDSVSVERLCFVSDLEWRWLNSPEAPILLLRRRNFLPDKSKKSDGISQFVAPGNPYWGIMLPYTPLHKLLIHYLQRYIVATSGNIADEPICLDNAEALNRLNGIADYFLLHNRPILRHADDSIGRVINGCQMILRRARGYAPLPIRIPKSLPGILAVGGHLKNTVAVSKGQFIFASQHIGDLESEKSYDTFSRIIKDISEIYKVSLDNVSCDKHPDYLSTRYAEQSGLPISRVQHHYAHILSCMAENELDPPVLGLAWDGTGWGIDGTIWGGEFLSITAHGFDRVANFRPFPLPGGDKAISEPRRAAFGLLYTINRHSAVRRFFKKEEFDVLTQAVKKRINAPLTSSVGRLFDVLSALLDIQLYNHYEGQAAMKLEYMADLSSEKGKMDYKIIEYKEAESKRFVIDWQPMFFEVLDHLRQGLSAADIARRFHNTLIEIALEVARLIGEKKVVLSGGCFQNRLLTEGLTERLQKEKFKVYFHQRIPPNDGGICIGQVIAVSREAERDVV